MSRVSASDRIRILTQLYTQKQIAERLGVSIRTVRRWLNSGVQPTPENRAKLVKHAANARRTLIRRGSPAVPVPPTIKIVKDTTIVTPHLSKSELTVENVKRFFDLAKYYRDKTDKEIFRLLIRTYGGSPEYPSEIFYSTGWMSLDSTDFDIAEWLVEEYNLPHVMRIEKIFVA